MKHGSQTDGNGGLTGSISSWSALHVEHVQVEGAEEEEGTEDDLEEPQGEVLQI